MNRKWTIKVTLIMAVIDIRRAYTYFSNHFVLKKSTNGWYVFDCPFCGKSHKHAVSFTYEYTKCWSCGLRGGIQEFVESYEDCSYEKAQEILWNTKPTALNLDILEDGVVTTKVSNVDFPVGYKGLFEGKGSLAKRARRYLEGRDFDLKQLDMQGFGYCDEHADEDKEDFFGYIIIPFKVGGKLVYYIGRTFTKAWLRYKNPATETFGVGKAELIFNEDALALYSEVFVAEGWSDAATMGRQGTSTQGWSLSRIQKDKYMRSKVKKLVIVPDRGADERGTTFYEHGVKTALDFMDSGKELYVLDLNIAEFDDKGKDINEIGRNEILKLYKNTPPLTYSKAMEVLTK